MTCCQMAGGKTEEGHGAAQLGQRGSCGQWEGRRHRRSANKPGSGVQWVPIAGQSGGAMAGRVVMFFSGKHGGAVPSSKRVCGSCAAARHSSSRICSRPWLLAARQCRLFRAQHTADTNGWCAPPLPPLPPSAGPPLPAASGNW